MREVTYIRRRLKILTIGASYAESSSKLFSISSASLSPCILGGACSPLSLKPWTVDIEVAVGDEDDFLCASILEIPVSS